MQTNKKKNLHPMQQEIPYLSKARHYAEQPCKPWVE